MARGADNGLRTTDPRDAVDTEWGRRFLGCVHSRTKTGEPSVSADAVQTIPAERPAEPIFVFGTDLAGRHEWNQIVVELAGLLLLDGEVAESELWLQVAEMTADLGFRFTDAGGARTPETHDADWAAADTARRMNTFDMIERLGDWPHRRLRLTPIGRTTMLAYLRHRATRPMTGMSG